MGANSRNTTLEMGQLSPQPSVKPASIQIRLGGKVGWWWVVCAIGKGEVGVAEDEGIYTQAVWLARVPPQSNKIVKWIVENPQTGALAKWYVSAGNQAPQWASCDELRGDAHEYLMRHFATESEAGRRLHVAQKELDAKVTAKYAKLSTEEIQALVVDDKWMAALAAAVQGERDRVLQTLTGRIRQLAERYEKQLPTLVEEMGELTARVEGHLEKMGFVR
jgi:hypothetical protein